LVLRGPVPVEEFGLLGRLHPLHCAAVDVPSGFRCVDVLGERPPRETSKDRVLRPAANWRGLPVAFCVTDQLDIKSCEFGQDLRQSSIKLCGMTTIRHVSKRGALANAKCTGYGRSGLIDAGDRPRGDSVVCLVYRTAAMPT
jgi:hypothetical protein